MVVVRRVAEVKLGPPISRVQAPRLTVDQKKAVEALLSTADADGLRVEFMLQVCRSNAPHIPYAPHHVTSFVRDSPHVPSAPHPQPGDVYVVNNHHTYHGRSSHSFLGSEEEELSHGRLAYRLWLTPYRSQPLNLIILHSECLCYSCRLWLTPRMSRQSVSHWCITRAATALAR